MRRPRTHLAVAVGAVAVLTLSLLFATTTSAFARSDRDRHREGLVFVQSDNPSANQVAVYERAHDGMLTFKAWYATGGMGGVAAGSAVDPLASQGSLATADDGRLLLAVNAGSNTVSLFRVHGDRLILRQVIFSGGEFPVSIAVHERLVYVLNAGGAGSVRGFRIVGQHLRRIRESTRWLGLANTTPPNFLSSPGQVGFTPDGAQLIVTTKASGSYIDIFDVHASGRLSEHPLMNSSATPVPFAFTFDPAGLLVVAEAAGSEVSTYTINPDNTLTTLGSVPDGQAALCWISAARGFYYVSNAGSANLSAYTLTGAGLPSLVGVAATTEAGTIDSVATRDQRFLYVECGGAGTIDCFRVHHDGSLTRIQTVTGLPTPFEGIALN